MSRLCRVVVVIRKLHLYTALLLGAFFALLGLSGSWLVFYPEFDSYLLGVDTRPAGAESISWQRVLEASDRALSTSHGMTSIQLPFGETGPARIMSQVGPEMMSLQYAQAYVEPVQARVLATKQVLSGDQAWWHNISGVSAAVHMGLFMGPVGYLVIGVLGVFLLFTTLSGLWMWWPRGRWRRSAFMLTAKFNSRAFMGDLHRISGLYASVVLIVLSVSGIYFGFSPWIDRALSRITHVAPKLDLMPAHDDGESHMAGGVHRAAADLDEVVAAARGRFPLRRLQAIRIMRVGTPMYLVSLTPFDHDCLCLGTTDVLVDASGEVRGVRNPSEESAADQFIRWQRPLHIGSAFGFIGKSIVFIAGLLPLAFLVTGVLIWWRRTRRGAGAHRPRIA